jgi:Chromo (CHRromatin Organisation MOdifier) domain
MVRGRNSRSKYAEYASKRLGRPAQLTARTLDLDQLTANSVYIPNDPDLFPAREPPRPPLVIPEEDRYEVERIVDYRILRQRCQYLVKRAGYPDSDNSWVDEEDIDRDVVKEYCDRMLVGWR